MKFTIPKEKEVELYIREKKGWHDDFCKYYAERFYNYYQSNGWKVSGKAAMKDWKAAFNSQWQTLKYKEDIELFNKLSKKMETINTKTETGNVGQLDVLIDKYSKHPTTVPFYEFGKWYEFMKSEKLLAIFTKEKVEEIKSIYKNDNYKCRCACVQITIDGYVNSGFTIAKIMEIRRRLNA